MFTLKLRALHDDVKMPGYAHPGDAGMDIYADESVTLAPGERHPVKTGFATEFPDGFVALVWDRSSMAVKHGMKTMAGVVDSGYRGEWMVVMINLTDQPYAIERGDKIAQAIFQPFIQPVVEIASDLTDSSRGAGGFGSTGT